MPPPLINATETPALMIYGPYSSRASSREWALGLKRVFCPGAWERVARRLGRVHMRPCGDLFSDYVTAKEPITLLFPLKWWPSLYLATSPAVHVWACGYSQPRKLTRIGTKTVSPRFTLCEREEEVSESKLGRSVGMHLTSAQLLVEMVKDPFGE